MQPTTGDRRKASGCILSPSREPRIKIPAQTFDFLGFTHISGKTQKGYFTVKRKTVGKRMRPKLEQIQQQLRARMHHPVRQMGEWLQSVVPGYFNYHAVPGNLDSLGVFRERVTRHWRRTLRDRSQTHRVTWARMHRLALRWLPQPRVLHPYPEDRFAVRYLRQEPYALMSARKDLCGGC